MFVSDYIRDDLLSWAGVHETPSLKALETHANGGQWEDYASLKKTEWLADFEALMRARLIVGSARYGKFGSKEKGSKDPWPGLMKKLRLYENTGNAEYLVDIANYAMVMWMYSRHPEHHYKGTDHDDMHDQLEEDIAKSLVEDRAKSTATIPQRVCTVSSNKLSGTITVRVIPSTPKVNSNVQSY